MNVKEYLKRIGIDENFLEPTPDNLELLQRQHLSHIPFENLDIHWQRPIVLDTAKFYKKIVESERGGFCYELNGLFAWLLNSLGFQSKIISARVFKASNELSPEYDHLAILTKIEDEECLVDVGFGSFIAEPLKFILNVEQMDATGTYLIKKYDENYFQVVKKDNGQWVSEIAFQTLSRDLSEFAEMCNFHQTSPESHFTQGEVCSLMTASGRKTLTDNKFIETKDGKKSELPVESAADFERILEREFNIRRDF